MNYDAEAIRKASTATPIAKRVVLAIVGGLRPDAIEEFSLSNIQTVAELGASTLTCKSVSPAYATTCVASIMTGVSPSEHGMRTDRLSFPRNLGYLDTLPRLIANEGYQVSAFMGEIPPTIRGTAGLVGRELGFPSLSFAGNTSAEVLRSALHALCSQRRGLIALYFSDADRAGHEYGWMSHEYGIAARKIDQSIGILNALSAPGSGESMLVVVADHGGGGENSQGHVSEHPLDVTVPLVLAGRHIARCTLGGVSLLDIPPTILRALGITVPRSYEGRVLTEAFDNIKSRAAAFA
jgi:hypothetical protein